LQKIQHEGKCVDVSCSEFRWTHIHIYIFHLNHYRNKWLSRIFFQNFRGPKVIFQDFPGPGIFKKKSRTFQEAWEVGNPEWTKSHAKCWDDCHQSDTAVVIHCQYEQRFSSSLTRNKRFDRKNITLNLILQSRYFVCRKNVHTVTH